MKQNIDTLFFKLHMQEKGPWEPLLMTVVTLLRQRVPRAELKAAFRRTLDREKAAHEVDRESYLSEMEKRLDAMLARG